MCESEYVTVKFYKKIYICRELQKFCCFQSAANNIYKWIQILLVWIITTRAWIRVGFENILLKRNLLNYCLTVFWLICRHDMELELRCFMTDEFQTVDWPMPIIVTVNSVQLQPHQRRPLGIKSFCHPGMNVLQISVCRCCCVSSLMTASISVIL